MGTETNVNGFSAVKGDGRDYIVKLEGLPSVHLGSVGAVYTSHKHYIVFTDAKGELYYACDETLDDPGEQFNTLWSRVQAVKSLPMQNAESFKDSIYASLGTAVGCAFEGDYTTANDAVEQARSTLYDASRRKAKTWYMPAAALVGIVLCAFGLYAYMVVIKLADTSATGTILRVLAASLAGGSLGGFLSAVGPRAESSFDPFASRKTAWLDGGLRIVYGVATAFVVTLAVETQFVSSSLVSNDKTQLALLLVAVVGGFLERWAIDIVRSAGPQTS